MYWWVESDIHDGRFDVETCVLTIALDTSCECIYQTEGLCSVCLCTSAAYYLSEFYAVYPIFTLFLNYDFIFALLFRYYVPLFNVNSGIISHLLTLLFVMFKIRKTSLADIALQRKFIYLQTPNLHPRVGYCHITEVCCHSTFTFWQSWTALQPWTEKRDWYLDWVVHRK